MASLNIEFDENPTEITVRLIGEGSTSEADRLQLSLTRLMAVRPPLVVIDMAGLLYVTSLAMGVLVQFRRAIARSGGRIQLAHLQPSVLESFQNARLDSLFEITESGLPVRNV